MGLVKFRAISKFLKCPLIFDDCVRSQSAGFHEKLSRNSRVILSHAFLEKYNFLSILRVGKIDTKSQRTTYLKNVALKFKVLKINMHLYGQELHMEAILETTSRILQELPRPGKSQTLVSTIRQH